MLNAHQLLSIIGARIPNIYDVIPPRYFEQLARRGHHAAEYAALNPQPLPPMELGAAIAMEIIVNARTARRFGLDVGAAFSDVEGLCPPIGVTIKLPDGWKRGLDPEPVPHPEWLLSFYLAFATRMAAARNMTHDEQLARQLDHTLDRTLQSMTTVQNAMTR